MKMSTIESKSYAEVIGTLAGLPLDDANAEYITKMIEIVAEFLKTEDNEQIIMTIIHQSINDNCLRMPKNIKDMAVIGREMEQCTIMIGILIGYLYGISNKRKELPFVKEI